MRRDQNHWQPPLQPKPVDQSCHMEYRSGTWFNTFWVTVAIFEFPPLARDMSPQSWGSYHPGAQKIEIFFFIFWLFLDPTPQRHVWTNTKSSFPPLILTFGSENTVYLNYLNYIDFCWNSAHRSAFYLYTFWVIAIFEFPILLEIT